MATFPPRSCCHTCTLIPHIVRCQMRGPNSARIETSSESCAKRAASCTSSNSACTAGWLRSPWPCIRASVSKHSSHRSLPASHRGDSGKKISDKPRIKPGTACTAQQIRKAAGPATVLEQPYAIKYMIRIPHSIAHCCIPTIRPRMFAGASSAR